MRIIAKKHFDLLPALGSLGLLLSAYAFQYIGGMAPCDLCHWQRYPHMLAIFLGLVLVFAKRREIYILGSASLFAGAGISLFHVGIEKSWWSVQMSCTNADISGLSAEELLAQILAAPVVRCDAVPWEMLGISMAGWNGLISAGLGLAWILVLQKCATPHE